MLPQKLITAALTTGLLLLACLPVPAQEGFQEAPPPLLSQPEPAAPAAESPLVQACLMSLTGSPPRTDDCIAALELNYPAPLAAQLNSALALQYARLGQIRAAETALNTALALDAGNPVVQGNLGNIQLLSGNYSEAVNAYNNALAQPSEARHQAAVYLNRSLALRGLGRYQEAKQDFDAYLNMGSYNISPPSEETVGIDALPAPAETR